MATKDKHSALKTALTQLDKQFGVGTIMRMGDKPSDRIELEGLTSYVIKSKYSENVYDVEKLTDLIPLL